MAGSDKSLPFAFLVIGAALGLLSDVFDAGKKVAELFHVLIPPEHKVVERYYVLDLGQVDGVHDAVTLSKATAVFQKKLSNVVVARLPQLDIYDRDWSGEQERAVVAFCENMPEEAERASCKGTATATPYAITYAITNEDERNVASLGLSILRYDLENSPLFDLDLAVNFDRADPKCIRSIGTGECVSSNVVPQPLEVEFNHSLKTGETLMVPLYIGWAVVANDENANYDGIVTRQLLLPSAVTINGDKTIEKVRPMDNIPLQLSAPGVEIRG